MKTIFRSLIFTLVFSTGSLAETNKKFMDCALEAEIVMQVVEDKVKEETLNEIILGWQKSSEGTFLNNNYIEEMVTFAYMNYPVMTKLEIANLQLNKCLKEEGLFVYRIWLPDT